MGDVPINSTGFAHGFRPLEGDHPPPTPTQQSAVPPGFPNPGLLSQSQRSSHGGGGGMSGGLDWPRKRRRLPGPLAFFQQGGSGIEGASGQDGGESDGDNDESLSDRGQSKSEAGGGHFRKGAWLSLCSAIDAPIPEEGSSDARAAQTFLKGSLSPMSEVLAGDFDLRVPVVTAVIDSYNKLSHSDVVVELVDPSGRMKGHLHPGCLEEHGPNLGPGAAILLKEVSIFVSGPGTTRLLNVHPACVLAVFPTDSPLPRPARLDWLRTCYPPFTPRPVSDGGSNTGQPEEHLTSSPTSSTSKTPRVGGAGGRRAQPVGRDERHRSQQQAPPRPPPPRPQQPQLAELCMAQGGSRGLGQSASSAINSTVLGNSQGACRGEYDGEEEEEEEEAGEEEEDRLLQSAASVATGGTAPSLRHDDTDGAPSLPLSSFSPEGTPPSRSAQPPLRPAPDGSLTPYFPGSTPLAKSQSQPGPTPVSGGGGLEGGGGTAPLRDTSRGTTRQTRADRTGGSPRKGCEGGEGTNPTTARDDSRAKAGRPAYVDSPRYGSSGSAFLDRPADRSETRVSLQDASPPVSTLDRSGPQKRTRGTQQQEENTAEPATSLPTAPETHSAQAAVDAGCAATARTIAGEEKGGSKNEPAGLGVTPIESVDGQKGDAGQTRVSRSMWSDLDDLDSDDSDEPSSSLLPGHGSSIGDALRASGHPRDDGQGTDASTETTLAKKSGCSLDSTLREIGVGGRGKTASSGVEGERGALAGDISVPSSTAIPTGGNITRIPQSSAAPDRQMTESSGQADVSTGDALSQNLGGTPVTALSGASTVGGRGGVFSLLGGGGGFENDDLLDAALDDSDQE